MNNQETIICDLFNDAFAKKDPNVMLNYEGKDTLDDYYKGVFNLLSGVVIIQFGDISKHRHIVDDTIKVVESKEHKNSEDYALLSILYGLTLKEQITLTYHNNIINKAKLFAAASLKLNKYNVRAYYSLAIIYMELNRNSDYKKSIGYLQDAIEILQSDLDSDNPIQWGKDWCYAFILLLYKYNDDHKYYEQYKTEAEKLYPNSEYVKGVIEAIKARK